MRSFSKTGRPPDSPRVAVTFRTYGYRRELPIHRKPESSSPGSRGSTRNEKSGKNFAGSTLTSISIDLVVVGEVMQKRKTSSNKLSL